MYSDAHSIILTETTEGRSISKLGSLFKSPIWYGTLIKRMDLHQPVGQASLTSHGMDTFRAVADNSASL